METIEGLGCKEKVVPGSLLPGLGKELVEMQLLEVCLPTLIVPELPACVCSGSYHVVAF